jgi:hypothetical protein
MWKRGGAPLAMYFAKSESKGCASRILSRNMGWMANGGAMVMSIEVEVL